MDEAYVMTIVAKFAGLAICRCLIVGRFTNGPMELRSLDGSGPRSEVEIVGMGT